MASRSIDDLHPSIRDRAVRLRSAMFIIGSPILITCTYRSNDEQDQAYARGRTAPGKVITNARGGQSPHNVTREVDGCTIPSALAFDVCFGTPVGDSKTRFSSVSYDGPWGLVVAIAKHVGLAWGGDWQKPDRPHFYHPEWRDLAREAGFLS